MATAHEPHQAASKSQILRNELVLRDHALTYPETQEEFPWGHRALKVKGKSFLFLGNGLNGDEMSLSVKLRESHETALLLPFAEPTGYGLGKSGWITARFPAGEDPPLPLLMGWIDGRDPWERRAEPRRAREEEGASHEPQHPRAAHPAELVRAASLAGRCAEGVQERAHRLHRVLGGGAAADRALDPAVQGGAAGGDDHPQHTLGAARCEAGEPREVTLPGADQPREDLAAQAPELGVGAARVQEQPRPAALLLDGVAAGRDERRGHRLERAGPGVQERLLVTLGELPHIVLEQRVDQGAACREQPIDQRARDPGALGDLGDLDVLDALLGQDPGRDVQELPLPRRGRDPRAGLVAGARGRPARSTALGPGSRPTLDTIGSTTSAFARSRSGRRGRHRPAL